MIHEVLNQRENLYGDFTALAPLAQTLKRLVRSAPSYGKLTDIQVEVLENIAVKLARILNGDPLHPDNWQDIAGYASLAHEELINANLPKTEPVHTPRIEPPLPPTKIPYGKADAQAKGALQNLDADPVPAFLTNGKKDKSL